MKKLLLAVLVLCACAGFAQVPNTISNADKVYGLSKFWQEVNYNFVYYNRVDKQKWDSLYKALIIQVQQTPDDYSYYRLLQKFCAFLHDGHTNVWMSNNVGALVFTRMFGDYWFSTENIGGKAIITQTLVAKIKEMPIGSEVVEVNGLSTAQYLEDSIKPYISCSTDYVLEDEAVGGMLRGLLGQTYNIKIKKPDGSVASFSLTHTKTTDTAFYPAMNNSSKLMDIKWYNDIAYVALNSFGDRSIDTQFIAALPELYKAKGVIIDLRNNGGGSTDIGTNILHYLMPDSIMQHEVSTTREHTAVYKAWGKYVNGKDTVGDDDNKKAWLDYHDGRYSTFPYSPDTFHLAAQRLVVPTAVLVSHNTASAAEDFLICAADQKHIVRIGSKSFGSTGQPYLFDMPGGGGARVCTKKDTYPDGTEFVGYGVKPDIAVSPTVQDFIAHKDPVLDTALQYLRKKIGG